MEQKEKDIKAATIAARNSYIRALYGDAQLGYVFFEGMKYGRTGEMPKDLLDDEDFVKMKQLEDKL